MKLTIDVRLGSAKVEKISVWLCRIRRIRSSTKRRRS